MADKKDVLELRGIRVAGDASEDLPTKTSSSKRFLSVWFRCCNTYGRMTRNKQQTAYEGRCPKCGAKVRAAIGPGGSNRRMFEAR